MMTKKFKVISDNQCPVRYVLDRFGDKWSTLVIVELSKTEKKRFGEILKSLDDISQKMLTKTLRTLEADGLVTRIVFSEIPPRVEYQLTDMGRSLVPHINELVSWATSNFMQIKKAREQYGI